MGWFRRRRRAESRVVFLSAAGLPVTPMYAPRPVEPRWTPPVEPSYAPPAPPPPPVAEEPEQPRVGVLLGFVDGSELRLAADDPTAAQLLATADALRRSAERPIGR